MSGFHQKFPAKGTRVAHDMHHRPKTLVQWANKKDKRETIDFPTEAELHETEDYHWQSYVDPSTVSAEPTADLIGSPSTALAMPPAAQGTSHGSLGSAQPSSPLPPPDAGGTQRRGRLRREWEMRFKKRICVDSDVQAGQLPTRKKYNCVKQKKQFICSCLVLF